MMNKKGLQFKTALFSIVVVSMFIMAIGFWVDDWNTQYDSGLTYDLESYSNLDEMSEYSSATKTGIAAKSSFESTDLTDFQGTSLRGAFGIIMNIFTPFEVVFGEGGLVDSIQDRWGIPNYIVIGFITMMLIAIAFTLIAVLFRRGGDV